MPILSDATQSVIEWAGLQAPADDTNSAASDGGDHDLFGWRVRSALPLTGVQPWRGADSPPDLVFRFGEAAVGAGGRAFSPALTIGGDRSVLIAIPGLGRFAIPDDATVIIERAEGAPDSALHAFLLGDILPVICLLRGLVPLRASGVAIDGKCLLLAGMPAVGKSTLAAHLLARGARLIGDGFCALRHCRERGPELYPGVGAVQLWSDAFAPLGLPLGAQYHPGAIGRCAIPVETHALRTTPIQPASLALMAIANDIESATATPLPPGHAMRPRTLVVGWRLAGALGCEDRVFEALAAMLARTACVHLRRGGAAFELDTMARLLMEAG